MMSNAKLEKKLYLAKESPEPLFDLSDCDLKQIPNICTTIKVLRKECLCLQNNQLTDLRNVKNFGDLCLLTVLDMSFNKITNLPKEIKNLENLKILRVNNNRLETLPKEIGSVRNMEQLIVSTNKLTSLPETVCHLLQLQVLDLRQNNIRSLPTSMYKNRKLRSLLLDENDKWECPPKSVIAQGTAEILSYFAQKNGLSNNELLLLNEESNTPAAINSSVSVDAYDHIIQDNLRRLEKEKERILSQRMNSEKNLLDQQQKELTLHRQNQNEKQKFLMDIQTQQRKIDEEVQMYQTAREREQERFIQQLSCVKNTSDDVIMQLLKTNAEQKKHSVNSLITSLDEKLPLRDLQTNIVLESMEKLLLEEYTIRNTIEEKEFSRKILINDVCSKEEEELQSKVETLLSTRRVQQESLIKDIKSDTDLQHAALLMLVEKSDYRNIELHNQITLIQSQLSKLTTMELRNKRLNMDMHINEIAQKRSVLSELLMDIFQQQQAYHQQMVRELREMERRQTLENEKHYWLMRYQQLLNIQPDSTKMINPSLLYELALYGLSHYASLLAVCRKNLKLVDDYAQITDSDLIRVGISAEEERSTVLRAIQNWLRRSNVLEVTPSAPTILDLDENFPSAPTADEFYDSTQISLGCELSNECVICLDNQSRVVFLPCGHLCSCTHCSISLSHCPLCRCDISQKMQIFTS